MWSCSSPCCIWLCRGKLLNVRDASAAQIAGNAEIQAIKQIMGLQHGKVHYTLLHCIMVSCDAMSSCMAAATLILPPAQEAGNSWPEILVSYFVCSTKLLLDHDAGVHRCETTAVWPPDDHDRPGPRWVPHQGPHHELLPHLLPVPHEAAWLPH